MSITVISILPNKMNLGKQIYKWRILQSEIRNLAEARGFEPLIPFGILAFQASALDHYATPPEPMHFILFLVAFQRLTRVLAVETKPPFHAKLLFFPLWVGGS